jgi:hypothetical protein
MSTFDLKRENDANNSCNNCYVAVADPEFSHGGGGGVADLPNSEKYLRGSSGLKK